MLFGLSQQQLLTMYWVVGVGLLGGGILAWKLGRLGWSGMAVKGLRSRGTSIAFLLWIAAVAWSITSTSGRRPAQPHTSTATVVLFVLYLICTFTIGRMSAPLPLRMFNMARTLHELAQEAYGVSPDAPAERQAAFGTDFRVVRAEALYHQVAEIARKRIGSTKAGGPWHAMWSRNLAAAHIQLAILNTQKNQPERALDNARAAQAALAGLSPAVLAEPRAATLVDAAGTQVAAASRLLGQDPPDSPVPPAPSELAARSMWSEPSPATSSQQGSTLPGIGHTVAFLTTLGIGAALGVALDNHTARAWAALGPFQTRMSAALAVSVLVASLIAAASARRQLMRATLRGEQVPVLGSLGYHAFCFLAGQLCVFSTCAYFLMPSKRVELFVNNIGPLTRDGILAGVVAAEIAAAALTGKLARREEPLMRSFARKSSEERLAARHESARLRQDCCYRCAEEGHIREMRLATSIITDMTKWDKPWSPTQSCFQCGNCGRLTCWTHSDNRRLCECGVRRWIRKMYLQMELDNG